MSKTKYGGTNDEPEGIDLDACFIPPIQEMNRTRRVVRKFLHDKKIFYREAEYDHYSIFRLQNGLEVNLLGYECEYQEPGDIFINRPMFDALFGAPGSTRIGITNIDNGDFEEALREFLGG